MTAQSVQVQLELGHSAHFRKQPTEQGYTHDWQVFLRGPDGNKISNFVDKVVFHLHESFLKPRRVVKEPPYEVRESGYAGFIMPIDVYFKNKEEPRKLEFKYDLFLNTHETPPVNFNRSEKLTFQNPSEEFRRKLIKGGGVGVPSANDYAVHQPENGSKSSGMQKSAPPAPVPPETSKDFSDIFGAPIKPEMHKKKEKSHTSSSSSSKDKHRSKSSSSHSNSNSKTSSKDSSYSKDKSSPPSKEKSSSKRPAEESNGDSAERKKKRKEEKREKSDKSERSDKSSDKHDKSERSEKSGKEKSKSPKDKEQSLSQSLVKSSDSSRKKDLSSSQSSSKSSKSSSHKSSKKSEKSDKSDKTERTESLSSSKGSSKQAESDTRKMESPKSPKQKAVLEPLSDLFSEGSSDEFDDMEGSRRNQSSSLSSMMEQMRGPYGANEETLVSPLHERPYLFSSSSDESPEKESPKKEKEKKKDKEKSLKHHEHKSSSSKKDKKSDKHSKDSSSKEKRHRKDKSRSYTEKTSKKTHTESPSEQKTEPSPVKLEPSPAATEEQKYKADEESNMSKASTGFLYEEPYGEPKRNPSAKQEVQTEELKQLIKEPSPVSVKEEENSDMSLSDDNEKPPELELRAPNGELMSELKQMYSLIMGSRDTNLLQKIVDVIEETGMFVVSDRTFDFDLCKLDSATVVKIKNCIQAVS